MSEIHRAGSDARPSPERNQIMKRYHTTFGRNGTEDEITIRRPNGEAMAVIQYWDEPDTNDGKRAEKTAKHIVDALNAYGKTLRLPKPRIFEQDDDDSMALVFPVGLPIVTEQ
jgi:hypothetical protein